MSNFDDKRIYFYLNKSTINLFFMLTYSTFKSNSASNLFIPLHDRTQTLSFPDSQLELHYSTFTQTYYYLKA